MYDEPRITSIICLKRSMYAGGSGACGSCKKVRYVIINIDECVRVGSDSSCVDGRIDRRDVAKEEIGMSMEEST